MEPHHSDHVREISCRKSPSRPASGRVTLRSMTEAEFQDYAEKGIANYAASAPKYRHLSREEAIQAVRKEYFGKILPQGFATPGHLLYTLRLGRETLGYMHFGETPALGSRVLHAWDFLIFESFRGHGYGKQAMLAAGELLKQRGYRRITLSVMGDNLIARGLYEAMGFGITQMHMAREL